MKLRCASFLALALGLWSGASRADTDPLLAGTPSAKAAPVEEEEEVPPVAVALAAGAATSFVSLAAGGSFLARANSEGGRNRALLLGQGGLVLSPIVAHAMVGEIGRGALFAILPALAEIGMGALVAVAPDVVTTGPASQQLAFVSLLTVSVLGSGLGVIDVVHADTRAVARSRPARAGLVVAPLFAPGLGGLSIGGIL